jgi:hypothetical protein
MISRVCRRAHLRLDLYLDRSLQLKLYHNLRANGNGKHTRPREAIQQNLMTIEICRAASQAVAMHVQCPKLAVSVSPRSR